MANNSMMVSSGKPVTTGAVFRAVRTNNLVVPTTVSASLDSAYKCMGYISEDGIKNGSEIESDTIKAWGGDVVMAMNKGRTDTFTFKMLEVLNEEVLKAVYVDSNVSVTAATSSAPKTIGVSVNNTDQPECVWVIDMVMRGSNPKRIVIPYGKVTAIAEINYKDDDAVGYDVTLTCNPDTSGNTHYEYMTVGSATT